MESIVKSFVLKITLQGIGYLLPIILLFYVSADVYGDYVVQNTIALVISTLFTFSLGNTHIYFDNKSSYNLILKFTIMLSILLTVISFICEENLYVLAAIYAIQKFNNAYLRDKKHIVKFYGVQILERIIFILLVLVFTNSLNIGLSIINLLIFSTSVVTIPLFLFLVMRKSGKYSSDVHVPWVDLVIWSLRGHAGVAAQKINTKLDILLLSLFLPSAIVGHYNILVSLSILVWSFPDSLNSFLLKELVDSNNSQKAALIKKYTKFVFLGVVFCLGIYMAFSKYILSLYTGFPVNTGWMLVVLTLGTSAFALVKPKIRYFTSMNYPEVGSIAALICLLNTLTVAPLLIWKFGLSGAVVASAIGYVLPAIYMLNKRLK